MQRTFLGSYMSQMWTY